MPFEIKFFGDDPKQTIAEVKALLQLGFAVEADKGSLLATAPPKAPRKPSQKTEPKQVDLEEAIAARAASDLDDDISDVGLPAEDKPDDAGETAPPVSKDDVRTKLIELMKANGEDAPTKLLSDHFKVSKIGELKETDYAAVVQKADEAIKGK